MCLDEYINLMLLLYVCLGFLLLVHVYERQADSLSLATSNSNCKSSDNPAG